MKRIYSLMALGLFSMTAFANSAKGGEFIRRQASDFEVTEAMLQDMAKNDSSFYSVSLMTKEKLMLPERKSFVDLDYMGLSKRPAQHYLVSKHTYMLPRSADFFSCNLLNDIKYVRALEKENVSRVGEMKYLLKGDKFGVYKYQFDLNWFADLPDCQNIKDGNAAMNEALSKSRDTDSQISLKLHGSYLKDKPNFTKFLTGGWIFAKIFRVPDAKGEKTLLVTYEISAMDSQYASMPQIVENGHIQVMQLEEKANSGFKQDN
jgi:hypothetical protein